MSQNVAGGRMNNNLAQLDSNAGILCPSCASTIGANEMFCPTCGAPIGTLATVDPLQTIRAEGFLLGKATEGRPKPIVLIGMWIMFFPAFIICAIFSLSIIYDRSGEGASDFLFFWGGVGLSVLFGVMLFKVTRNYLKPAESKNEENEDTKL